MVRSVAVVFMYYVEQSYKNLSEFLFLDKRERNCPNLALRIKRVTRAKFLKIEFAHL